MAGSTAIDPDQVARFSAALDRLNSDGGKIGLAVSGGSDSMAMLLLAQKAVPGGFEVATVDHGLRPEATEECAQVVAACEERGVPCEVLGVEVGEGNVLARARHARYDALSEWAKRRGLAAVATAHHADDQMETMLMRLNRGCGVQGLAGIREHVRMADGLSLIRPLLGFARSELDTIIADSGIAVAHDPSNRDASYERVRMRQALAEVDWLDSQGFAQSALHLEAASQLCERAVSEWLNNHARSDGETTRHKAPEDRWLLFPVLEAQFLALGARPRGRDLARLLDRLGAGKGGNVAGVMVSVEGGDWVYRPEPPRRTG